MNKKISLGEPKRVLGRFALNSKNGVKTPRWRILGTKKCRTIRSKKLLWIFLKFTFAISKFINNKIKKNEEPKCVKL